MLGNLSAKIAECYRRAGECRRRAAALTASPNQQRDFEDLEKGWLILARSYEIQERLSRFNDTYGK